jgi:hypothetical protein
MSISHFDSSRNSSSRTYAASGTNLIDSLPRLSSTIDTDRSDK